jgi:hypothetical protein
MLNNNAQPKQKNIWRSLSVLNPILSADVYCRRFYKSRSGACGVVVGPDRERVVVVEVDSLAGSTK